MEHQRVIRKHNSDYLRSGPASYASAHRRWGFTSSLTGLDIEPSEAKPRIIAGQRTNTNVASDADFQNDTHYTCPVILGTPAQLLHLDFDVIRSDSQVITATSSGEGSPIPSPVDLAAFVPSNSTTFAPGISGSRDPLHGADLLQINGVTLSNFGFKLIPPNDRESQYHGMGYLGLAPRSPVASKAGVFTAKFGNWRVPNDPEQKVSFFTFGFIHTPTLASAETPIRYAPLCGDRWMFPSTTALINDTQLERPPENAAIVDTVGPLALVDDQLLRALYNSIPGSYYDSEARGYLFPADIPTSNLPVVRLGVGCHHIAVHKHALGFCNHRSKPGYLYGGFQSRGDLEFDILGDTFLQGLYAVFDSTNQQFGAAELLDRTLA